MTEGNSHESAGSASPRAHRGGRTASPWLIWPTMALLVALAFYGFSQGGSDNTPRTIGNSPAASTTVTATPSPIDEWAEEDEEADETDDSEWWSRVFGLEIDRGLKWLADHQEWDGHWSAAKWGGKSTDDAAITGLVLMAFDGAGQTERSGKYKRVVKDAIWWLHEQQDAKGNFAPGASMYSHAIPTIALLEETAMCPVPRTQTIAKKGLDYMLSVRNDNKAWRYWPKDGNNDVSVTTWCTIAMKAAKVAGCDIPANAWAGVRSFLDEVTDPDSGEVGYTMRPIKGSAELSYQRYAMTACGTLARLYMGVPRDDPLIRKGGVILMENLPQWNQPGFGAPHYNYWYFGSLVLFQLEGDLWKKWDRKLYDLLISHQNKVPGDLLGSWEPSPGTDCTGLGGRLYSTALAVLTLEIHYRYEIINKASSGK
ncbi:MAG: hypothetical protein WC712_10685 [Candidatus Brocadiia bacterium]